MIRYQQGVFWQAEDNFLTCVVPSKEKIRTFVATRQEHLLARDKNTCGHVTRTLVVTCQEHLLSHDKNSCGHVSRTLVVTWQELLLSRGKNTYGHVTRTLVVTCQEHLLSRDKNSCCHVARTRVVTWQEHLLARAKNTCCHVTRTLDVKSRLLESWSVFFWLSFKLHVHTAHSVPLPSRVEWFWKTNYWHFLCCTKLL